MNVASRQRTGELPKRNVELPKLTEPVQSVTNQFPTSTDEFLAANGVFPQLARRFLWEAMAAA